MAAIQRRRLLDEFWNTTLPKTNIATDIKHEWRFLQVIIQRIGQVDANDHAVNRA
jgi:hypothetical protein